MFRKLVMASTLLGGMVFLGSSSTAQEFDPALFKLIGPAMRIMNSSPAALLANPGVQKELKLDEDQIKAVGEMAKTLGGGIGFGKGGKGGFDDAAKERMSKMMERLAKFKDTPEDQLEDKLREEFKDELEKPMKEVEKILKPDQMKRAKQITLQNAGLGGYTSKDAADLKLTDDQKKKIKDIAAELAKDNAELMQAAGGGGMGFGRVSPEVREKMMNLRKEAQEKAAEVLTADQKTKWKELTGEPFEVKFNFQRPKKDN